MNMVRIWRSAARHLVLCAALAVLPLASAAQAQGADKLSDAQLTQQAMDMIARHGAALDPAVQAAGEAQFTAKCAACHVNALNHAPPASMLRNLSPETILRAMTAGAMKTQAASLDQGQKEAVAQYIANQPFGQEVIAQPKMCAANPRWFDRSQPPPLAGWGFDAGNSHAIPARVAGLDRESAKTLKLKWALAFPGVLSARSQPIMAGGALFVGGYDGKVYALDPDTGCAHWTYAASGPIRMGLVVDGWTPGEERTPPRLYFGDLLGFAYALDAASGELVWKRRLDAHPNATLTGSPALHDGILYYPIASLEEPAAGVSSHECCTFRGSLVAIDAATGAENWRSWMVGEPTPRGKNPSGTQLHGPSGVAIWSTPVVDAARGLVYVLTGDNYSEPATELSDAIIAVNLADGKIRWHWQAFPGDVWNASCSIPGVGNCPEDAGPDFDFGAAPILAKGKDGKDYLLAGQKSGAVFALEPDSGKLVWTKRLGRGGILGGVHFGIAAANGVFFVPMSDFPDGGRHELPASPGLYAVDVATGDSVWSAPSKDVCNGKRFCGPGYGGAITVAGDLLVAGSTDGYLRVHDAANGALLWEVDTDIAYETVNGTMGHGGSMAGGAGPIVWGGRLFMNSGYGFLGKMPGNVLLMFAPE